jgi:hypothetical protein
VIKCVRHVVDDGMAVEGIAAFLFCSSFNNCSSHNMFLLTSLPDAVQEVIETAKPDLSDALLGMQDVVGGADRNTFIVSVHYLFEALSKPGDAENAPESIRWDVALDQEPSLTGVAVMKAVGQLVEKNLLSYVDSFTVSLHARALKWAYLELRGDKRVQAEFKTAVNLIQK